MSDYVGSIEESVMVGLALTGSTDLMNKRAVPDSIHTNTTRALGAVTYTVYPIKERDFRCIVGVTLYNANGGEMLGYGRVDLLRRAMFDVELATKV